VQVVQLAREAGWFRQLHLAEFTALFVQVVQLARKRGW